MRTVRSRRAVTAVEPLIRGGGVDAKRDSRSFSIPAIHSDTCLDIGIIPGSAC